MVKLGNVKVNWKRYKDGKGRTVTLSQVYNLNDHMIAIDKTACGNKDNYSPDQGRKLSLKRALEETNLSKEERSGIWEDYRRMTLTPRW